MKIYSSRHGQTPLNASDRICGVTDTELTETGIAQAKELAAKAAEIGDISAIICSPLKRARQTAEFAAKAIGCEIHIDNRLTEWDYGAYEGKDRYTEGFSEAKVNFGCRMKGGGESLLQLSHRVYSALDDIIEAYNPKNVLIVCHGGVCRVIETYFRDMTKEEFMNFFMGNCELIEHIV